MLLQKKYTAVFCYIPTSNEQKTLVDTRKLRLNEKYNCIGFQGTESMQLQCVILL